MKRPFFLRPRLRHDEASLIAQLALTSSIPARQLEELRYLLRRFTPARILAAIHQASADFADAGGPDWPRTRRDEDAYFLLLDGLQSLTRVYTYLPLAA
ncbi:hypothetical protein Q5H93_23280 [Hymenobacter sp. ASUV-10]|uniref:Uncharacterized protein n=1 Tax=Hymenobacter aranciens TaxID=3063996 RepID=A0ABT9BHG5_9BACT|nr:hypothetical protein [Hymenobacter sp. ASUV-10]MDO7877681.1 hypothetical protein [Hymenobacter sp. ASUV-10]